jgi:mono/diheme cytochrome c family protein
MLRLMISAMTLVLLPLAAMPPLSAAPQQDDLPEGPGKKILQGACASCHELTEITKFKGFYTKDDWQEVVVTMVKYGAQLKEREPEILVDYLAKNLGRKD